MALPLSNQAVPQSPPKFNGERIFAAVIKFVGFGGLVTIVLLVLWAAQLNFRVNSTAAQTEVHKQQIEKTGERLAKMERNILRLCLVGGAECEE